MISFSWRIGFLNLIIWLNGYQNRKVVWPIAIVKDAPGHAIDYLERKDSVVYKYQTFWPSILYANWVKIMPTIDQYLVLGRVYLTPHIIWFTIEIAVEYSFISELVVTVIPVTLCSVTVGGLYNETKLISLSFISTAYSSIPALNVDCNVIYLKLIP